MRVTENPPSRRCFRVLWTKRSKQNQPAISAVCVDVCVSISVFQSSSAHQASQTVTNVLFPRSSLFSPGYFSPFFEGCSLGPDLVWLPSRCKTMLGAPSTAPCTANPFPRISSALEGAVHKAISCRVPGAVCLQANLSLLAKHHILHSQSLAKNRA